MNSPFRKIRSPKSEIRIKSEFQNPKIAIVLCIVVGWLSGVAAAQRIMPQALPDNLRPTTLDGIRIDQKLDQQIPADLVFRDEDGNPIRLGDLYQGRPMVLSLVYYQCPMLCTVVLNDMLRSFVAVPLVVGKDFDVITVSFDPTETPQLASAKKQEYMRKYATGERAGDREFAERGWHFLTGDAPSIAKLTDAVGFRYKLDPQTKQYIHPSGITILTPSGKIARYFFGIDYEPTDLRLSLVEASQSKIGSLTDHVMLYCFHYDSTTGKYGFAVVRALRVGGVLTMIGMFGGITWLLRRERVHKELSK